MIGLLYKYVFRGIGVLLLIGIITLIILSVNRIAQERRVPSVQSGIAK
jgi:hypothetical protein